MNKFKLTAIAFSAIVMSSYTAHSQSKLENLLKKVTDKTKPADKTTTTSASNSTGNNGTANVSTSTNSAGTPSVLEIGQGIKQALEVGISHGADKLSAKDGFLGNMAVKILFPPEAEKVEKTLRSLGMGSLADKVVLSLNRAAEDAAKEAKPIFVAAIKQMTIEDAKNILLGNNSAATDYFKRVTTSQLTEKFRPVIDNSLEKVGASKYWSEAAGQYNKLPMIKPVTTDLPTYVTGKAVDGMFIQVAQEELTIRDNLNARSTSLLQKVFGYADKNK